MLEYELNKAKEDVGCNNPIKGFHKTIKVQLTPTEVGKIMNDMQNIIFGHKINTDALLKKIHENSLSEDTLDAVAHMLAKPKEAYKLIDECYDISAINCFVYVVLKTLRTFCEHPSKNYKEYAVLLVDRYLNQTIFYTDTAYEDYYDIDQSSFSRRKSKALKEFTKRLNAELNSFCHFGNEADGILNIAKEDETYKFTHNFLFGNIDMNIYGTEIDRSIFNSRRTNNLY